MSKLSDKVFNAVKRAASSVAREAGEPTPTASGTDGLRRLATEPQPVFPGSPIRQTPHARHGITPELWRNIGAELSVPEATLAALREAEGDLKNDYAELTRIAEKSPKTLYREHIAALAHAEKLDTLDGFSEAEWAAERQAKMAAMKVRLREKSLACYQQHTRAILEAALPVIERMIDSEIETEIQRGNKWGIPADSPSEIIRSLHMARCAVKQRLAAPPTSYALPSGQLFGLVTL